MQYLRNHHVFIVVLSKVMYQVSYMAIHFIRDALRPYPSHLIETNIRKNNVFSTRQFTCSMEDEVGSNFVLKIQHNIPKIDYSILNILCYAAAG